MADQDLAATGKDVRCELILNGALQNLADKVVRFEARPRYAIVETKPLGSNDVDIDHEHEGWEGVLEVKMSSPQMDDLVQAYNLNRRNRIPQVLNLVETANYRDGSFRTWTYPDVQLSGGKTVSRGQANIMRFQWRTGKNRF